MAAKLEEGDCRTTRCPYVVRTKEGFDRHARSCTRQVHLANEQSFNTALSGVELEQPRPGVAQIEQPEEMAR